MKRISVVSLLILLLSLMLFSCQRPNDSVPSDTPEVTNKSNLPTTVIAVEPDQTKPVNADEDSSYDSDDGDNKGLSELDMQNEEMRSIAVDLSTHVVFTVKFNMKPESPIMLVRRDTNQIVAFMFDDGNGADSAAGDGIFSAGLDIIGNRYGKMEFIAKQGEYTSNILTIRFYELLTEENEQHFMTLLSGQQKTAAQFVRPDGFVDSIDRKAAISSVGEYIKEQYLLGNVSDYHIGDVSVFYRDALTGISVVYEPPIEGELSGGVYDEVMILEPYASDTNGEQVSTDAYDSFKEQIISRIGFRCSTLQNSNVEPEVLTRIKPGQILIWSGHGAWIDKSESPILITGIHWDPGYNMLHALDFITGRLGYYGKDSARVYVTSEYIDKYGSDMTGCFIWLGCCHSGQNSKLANSFRNKGASTVVGYSDSVFDAYEFELFSRTMRYMAGIETDSNGMLSVKEAMDKVTTAIGADDFSFWNRTNENIVTPETIGRGPAHAIIYGEKNYTFPTPIGTYEIDDVFGQYIPVNVYADREIYHAEEPITFYADILGGTPPYQIRWSVEESQTRDEPTPLDQYMKTHPDYSYWTSYVTNEQHVKFEFIPPVDSDTLFGLFYVTDAKGIENITIDENSAMVEPSSAESVFDNGNVLYMSDMVVGQSVFFGEYEQDNDLRDGVEPIEWIVLDVDDDKVLLLSKYALDAVYYHNTISEVTWETSYIRKWLNNDFTDTAFTDTEKSIILDTRLDNSDERAIAHGYTIGNDTIDKVFLLSPNEMRKYMLEGQKCYGTLYSLSKGIGNNGTKSDCWGWLRLSRYKTVQYSERSEFVVFASSFYYNGDISDYVGIPTNPGGIRPAIWVRIR